MRVKLVVFPLVCLASSAALAASQDRDVAPFDSIHVASGIHATVTIGPAKPVHIEADQEVLPLVATEVEDRTLHIGFKPHTQLRNSGDVTVTV
ncbi:MAG TPA: DUF2807 domain-containing protein, partial [Myxococcales bacterium]|nr:DUF2807 domain-containing protein [Myxococcales bacterium]